jgi:hypothetical protein
MDKTPYGLIKSVDYKKDEADNFFVEILNSMNIIDSELKKREDESASLLANKADASAVSEHVADIGRYRSNMTDREIYPEILDMHYETLKGIGWNSAESGGEVSKTVTLEAAKGTYDLTLDSVSSLVPNQLIVIYTNGEYHTNIIKSIAGNVVTLYEPLEISISPNDALYNFYTNSTHPNIYGFRAITDTTLRNIIKPRGHKLLFRFLPSDFTYTSGTTVANGGFQQDYTEPFAVYDTKVITASAGESKYCIKQFSLESDAFLNFRTNVTINGKLRLLYAITDAASTTFYLNKTLTLGDTYPEIIENTVFLRKGTYLFKMRLLDTPGSFAFGKTEVSEVDTKYNMETFNNGVHLLLGDSWLEMSGICERLKERLPNATFINFGVGGNKSDALLRRFTGTATDADIKNDPANYGNRKDATAIAFDYVWVMCGTNDYSGSVASTTFKGSIDSIMKAAIDRGAKPFIFTSSVGQAGVSTNFTLSREYADIYYNQKYSVDSVAPRENVIVFNDVTIPLGTEKVVGIYGLVTPTDSLSILEAYYNASANITLKVGWGTVTTAISENIKSFTVSINSSVVSMGTPTANRYMLVTVQNASGTDYVASGSVRLKKSNA